MTQFTLVRHSAYAVGGDAGFEDAVEAFELNAHQAYRVRAAGGVLFATMETAQSAAASNNRAAGATHPTPSAPGYFSSLRLGGAEIYIPLPTQTGNVPASSPV